MEKLEEKRQLILNEERNEENDKKRFTRQERSIHTDIEPAALRIDDFKRK